MMIIFLVIFAVVSITHIVSIAKKKTALRQISKILIIPPLLGAYIAGAGSFLFFPIPALILGWIGDIVISKSYKLGLVSFLLGHICYILTFMECLGFFGTGGSFNFTALVICAPLVIILGITIFRFIKPAREVTFPVVLYMIAIETMAFWGLEVLIINPGLSTAVIFAGCLCFIFSDTLLSYRIFRKKTLLWASAVMFFYILAQAGIVLGLMGLRAYS